MSILVLTSDTLIGTPATGNLEYNGQFYGTDSNASRAQMQRITQGTAVASTSGTSITFSSIPAWVKRITVMFNEVSGSGTSVIGVQLGTSGGIQNTGYIAAAASNSSTTSQTTLFPTTFAQVAANNMSGQMIISLQDSSNGTWTESSNVVLGGVMHMGAGRKILSGTLTQIVITTVNGTDTFDAGSINILYEG